MFKLKKIDNSATNAPEICILTVNAERLCYPNQLMIFNGNELFSSSEDEAVNKFELYCVLDEKTDYEITKKVRCFRVTPDMQFVADTLFEVSDPNLYDLYLLGDPACEEGYSYVTSGEDDDPVLTVKAQVIDKSDFERTGKITVRLIQHYRKEA